MMAKTNPFEFLQQVRAEARKVSWPSRRETLTTTVMVLIFVVVASIFFLLVDWAVRFGLGLFLGI